MILTLSPIRSDETLTLHRSGDVLTINGTSHDFGPIPEGAVLPRAAVDCPWIVSDIARIAGRLHLTLLLPHGPIPAPPPPGSAVLTHPAPLDLTANGPVTLPHWTPEEPTP